MPTLNWIGKDKVVNHHLEVPFHVLERQYSFDAEGCHAEDNGSENMIIHGDNLLALKSLLPKYEGRIKCIYIDPPYNTGNESWVYNDNVNDPQMQRWLHQVVGKEGEDLSRHDKWLCMMYPRLKLLQRLLAEDGVIFISIDDNEQANLKLICDEIFGANCFVANSSWQRTYSTRNDSKGIVSEVEHVLIYSKQSNWNPNKLPRTAEMNARYSNPDNDFSAWKSTDAFAPGAATHQGMVYAIQNPFNGNLIYPSNGRCWSLGQDQMYEIMCGWGKYELKDIDDIHKRALICGVSDDDVKKGVQGIMLVDSLEESAKIANAVYERGQWPSFYFGQGGNGGIRRKTYLDNVGGKVPSNFWAFTETGHTDEAKKEMKALFDGKAQFDTPKPTRLLQFILTIATDKDSIVLDSFAGSGTTAHAVLNMNKTDGGNRKFICVEMMDYADTITAERVKRVINGYGEGKKAVVGTGGSFSFYELGEPLLIDEQLNEAVSTEKIREYIYYMETRQALPDASAAEPMLLGVHHGAAYYFNYEKQASTTLNRAFLRTIRTRAEAYVIYADTCVLSEHELEKYHITFKKIPRDIARL